MGAEARLFYVRPSWLSMLAQQHCSCRVLRQVASDSKTTSHHYTYVDRVCLQVYGRAVRIAASLGGFIARVGRDYALGQLDARMADRY